MKKKPLSPGRVIALGFAAVILCGTLLLLSPLSVNPEQTVAPIDALFTSTSAVCVTGLIAIDAADHFTVFGRTVLALLIQFGGLGVTSVGVGLIVLSGKKLSLRHRTLVKEGLGQLSFRGVLPLLRGVLMVTLCFELAGTLLSFIVFSRDYPPLDALGISTFHSIAAFNNSGFDILGGLRNLIPYQGDALLNLITCGLIFFGGIGFFVIMDLLRARSFRRLSLHSKVALSCSIVLILVGMLLLRMTDRIPWLDALFFSVSARTAGFSTLPLNTFTSGGLFVLIILMFIGASPGSTGGGIKTTTFVVLAEGAIAASRGKPPVLFKRRIPFDLLLKAFVITALAALTVFLATFGLCLLEPDIPFIDLLFEAVSAFGTVGLSTGITPGLCPASKLILILSMYIGRLGPFTIATLWILKSTPEVSYVEESLSIG